MIYFIALIIFLLPSYLVRFSVFQIPTTLLEILIYLGAITTALKFSIFNFQFSNKSQFSIFKQKQILIPIILFLLAGIISIFVSPDKREALGLFKAYILDPVLLSFVILINLNKKREILNPKLQIINKFQTPNSKQKLEIGNWKLEILLKSLILSGLVIALHAIWQKITGSVTTDGRVVGVFGYSPNYLALYLAPILVLLIAYSLWFMARKNLITLLPYILMTLIIIYALFLTGSRAAIGAVVIGVISYYVISYWDWIRAKKINILFFSFLVLLFLGLSWQIVKPNWNATPDSGRLSSSNNIRWEIWKTTAKDILPQKWLLGVGLGNYQDYFTELTKDRVNFPEWIAPRALTPHNLFLNIWVNMGLLGLIAFICLLYLFFKFISNKRYALSNMLFAVMITTLVQGMVDTPYWKNDLAALFWILLALSIVDHSLEPA